MSKIANEKQPLLVWIKWLSFDLHKTLKYKEIYNGISTLVENLQTTAKSVRNKLM